MKLYTEEQVKKLLDHHTVLNNMWIDHYLNKLTPIEIPSDDEINEEAQKQWGNVHRTGVLGFIDCAKWMRDKLTNSK